MAEVEKKKRARKRPQCGTVAGYRQHSKRGENTCKACKAARAEYMREHRAGEKRQRPEPRAKKQKAQEELGEQVVARLVGEEQEAQRGGEYPAFLRRHGRELWDEVTGSYDLDPAGLAVLTEACRMRDRLERFAAALSAQSTLWFELGEPEELESGEVQMSVVVNNMVGEARQMQAAVATALGKIGVLKPGREKAAAANPLDEIARKRRERLASGG
ncbi:hypothetical protein [Corynebacterium heidelbergense]|uniref:Terminase n=1 Tax=Corynebacterium heidelbergense TaxID=2055947 RepID=A0A364VCF3_9CORY|nr:hypothetical protein [Corynebacterium heidelbergense]RAV34246.1 hypothetical protein CWC39_04135 [Corynebacterium heidelbergense]WCZ36982.1 hypothetical protein CHEID_07245 [Corynebacterium heidelbergense]